MAEIKDPAIRLFGKTIPLLIISKNSGVSVVNSTASEDNRLNRVRKEEEEEENKESSRGKPIEIVEENHTTLISEEMKDPSSSSGLIENSQEPSIDKEIAKPKASENEKISETGISEEKTLKKPHKIIPCCRCNSMDTKFCYYNNYNVNQPRYFCKSCQRYWTDGGLMRNVPVGAGRRKNKNSSSPYRQIAMVEDLQTARNDALNGIHKSKLKENGSVLTFGSNAPLCESMDGIQNGFYRPEDHRIRVYREGENGVEHSSESSVTVCNSLEEGSKIPCYPGAPWPYPSQWGSHWGSTAPGIWGIPWMIPLSSSSPYHGAMGTSPSSSTLGKHSRDGDMVNTSNLEKGDTLKEIKSERCLWMPKTLRISDPSEAARSSIWTTLGIKNEKADSIHGGMLFNGFQSKGDQKIQKAEISQVLQANPAALSRSLNFHESS